MRLKLLIKGVFLLLLTMMISYAGLYLNPNYRTEYIAGVVLKQNKLKAISGNKIVVIGGSNGSFGIDSRLMERELGVPVVNMALHGGLPFKYVLEQVKDELKKGDLLLLTKEYGGLRNQYWNKMNGIELPKIVSYDFTQFKVSMTDKILFQSTLSGIFKTINFNIKRFPSWKKKPKGSVYSLESFDEDNLKSEVLHGVYEKEVSIHELPKLKKNGSLMKNLKQYADDFQEKGIEFFVTPPVIIEGFYKEKDIKPFWDRFSSYTGIPQLNANSTYVYPRKYFFNSHYHTNAIGREIRTRALIRDIKRCKASILQ